ncbi:MAG: glycosyltransferase family 4 protein [Deltaproteobacteria bacterium]|nr:MAG: glycosyltransferase family 4 protein [Deltaproteobacteria bacterium]
MSFAQLADGLRRCAGVEIEVIDTSRRNGASLGSDLRTALRILWATPQAIWRSDVVTFHASTPGTVRFGPLVYALARVLRKPVVLREFGGSFDDDYARMRALARWAVRLVFRADVVLLQTRSLVDHFRRAFPRSRFEWFPTHRPRASEPETSGEPGPAGVRRFVFVGHVKPTKGLAELLAAARLVDRDCCVDVYGPLLDGVSEDDFAASERVRYRGVLAPEAVIPTLRRYDAVLLPTYHFGEGYPGIVLEAYAAGRPVIATRFRAIPEIVEDGVSGLLVAPRDARDLARAMRALCEDDAKLQALSEGARSVGERFASSVWIPAFVDVCRSVVPRRTWRSA